MIRTACMNVDAFQPLPPVSADRPTVQAAAFGGDRHVGSNAAHTPRMLMSAYCASKAALTSLTDAASARTRALLRSLQPRLPWLH